MPMRVIVTGSRNWTDMKTLHGALEEVTSDPDQSVTIVHGGAQGADQLAGAWARRVQVRDKPWVFEELHLADWDEYGPVAGFRRNAEMVDAGAAVVLAFINCCTKLHCPRRGMHGSHGAEHCVTLARKAGISVIFFQGDR
jgi:hypothetical protein